VVRITPEGAPAEGNPFIGRSGAAPEIWSYGHRNIEAAAIDPATGLLWIAEFGPRGGDELNQPQAGKNYGWPKVSWGSHYDGRAIPDPPTQPQFTDAVIHWTPVISPSGMAFYTGDMFPAWQGNMLIGGLSSQAVIIVEVNGTNASEIDRIDMKARIRDVEQAPDGSIYLLTDAGNGKVLRLWR
jgi:glucose/arabinose dehydrogenase